MEKRETIHSIPKKQKQKQSFEMWMLFVASHIKGVQTSKSIKFTTITTERNTTA